MNYFKSDILGDTTRRTFTHSSVTDTVVGEGHAVCPTGYKRIQQKLNIFTCNIVLLILLLSVPGLCNISTLVMAVQYIFPREPCRHKPNQMQNTPQLLRKEEK